ncbi:Predicted amidohydrolase [Sphingomonas sp. NFR04]|uniref:carbon-nitrogen hydrolase family protein n=1 Tax=Sphingomonas sp. NFR04 TaxID=1566283 RepID=UPI0008E37FC9|nr:carbon-nitrogen hydrolase family protein [Sphingomonas sp. NFR04]SFK11060.1 Predicted amidohydrolase [Sphingomonas sp. NFR04]
MRIAAVQCRPVFDDAERTIAAIVARLRWAEAEGVDLLLFPEAWLLGHAYDAAVIRARAEVASNDALPALCARIARFPTTLVVGALEAVDGQVFNSAVVIEAGRIVGRYAKAHPNEDGVTPGTDFPVFARSDRRWGINICNDANFPDAAARLAEQGAGLILYPLNNLLRPETAARWREKSLANLIARARETGCWVASADVAGTANDRLSYGCTSILSPAGDVMARVPELAEGVAMFDLPGATALS